MNHTDIGDLDHNINLWLWVWLCRCVNNCYWGCWEWSVYYFSMYQCWIIIIGRCAKRCPDIQIEYLYIHIMRTGTEDVQMLGHFCHLWWKGIHTWLFFNLECHIVDIGFDAKVQRKGHMSFYALKMNSWFCLLILLIFFWKIASSIGITEIKRMYLHEIWKNEYPIIFLNNQLWFIAKRW